MNTVSHRGLCFGNLFLMLVVPHLLWLSMMPSLYFGFPIIAAPVILVFAAVPFLDYFTSRSLATPEEKEINTAMAMALKASPLIYIFCFYWVFYAQLGTLADIGVFDFVLTLVSFAAMGTILIAAGHELIHKPNTVLRAAGEWVFIAFGYWHFTLAHIHNHHALVATEADNHAPAKGKTFWQYVTHAYPKAVAFTFNFLKARHSKGQLSAFKLYSLLAVYFSAPFLFALGVYLYAGATGLLFYILTSLLSLLFGEAVFYVQHYDLKREKTERIGVHHSWDSDHRFSNYLTFMVQRHSDHHLKWGRQYYLLRTHSDSNPLPFGYPLMIVIALLPPLFFEIMNKRIQSQPKNNKAA